MANSEKLKPMPTESPERTELILRQIDTLPTLPAVATRLLTLTASEESQIQEVVDLVSADPSLTAKVLSLCRTAEKGARQDTLTVERAVVLLGFNTVRNAVLSVKVFELFDEQPGQDQNAGPHDPDAPQGFDRVAFWSHSLAVGILAELIAERQRHASVNPAEAFVCGLLHDIGKLALHHLLPKSYSRVVELTELNHGNIAEYERRIVGLDHHTAGKRLAEQWQLPHRLQDCIWLHGATPAAVPELPHRQLVGLVGLADLIARHQHVGYSGNYQLSQRPETLAVAWGFAQEVPEQVIPALQDRFQKRSETLGLHEAPSHELFIRSMQRANETLGRLNRALERRSRAATAQGQVLEAISSFHAQASPAQTVQDVLDAVAASAPQALGSGFLAVVCPGSAISGKRENWLISQYTDDGRLVRSQSVEAPPDAPELTMLDATQPAGLNLMGLLPWIADYLIEAEDLRRLQLLPLTCGWGTAAVLLHDRRQLPAWHQLSALASTWGAAIAAAGQHEGARRLGEQLAEANAALAEAQDRLLKQQSLARLGEMAAGAAHEMNNPLAVISGRSQLLTMALERGSREHEAAQSVFQAAHRLSDLISALRMFADPPKPERQERDLAHVLQQAVHKVEAGLSEADQGLVQLNADQTLPRMAIDASQLQPAVLELLHNAVQAEPTAVNVLARLEPGGERVVVQISDDGRGMDEHTLQHALDPFFSAKEAGRRMGMGLPRAQQWIAGHGGSLELHSTEGEGTVATFTLPRLQSASAPADTGQRGDA